MLAYDHTFNRLSLGASYTPQWFDYDNSISEFGEIIDNQDRDREEQSFLFRAGYQFASDKQAFLAFSPYSVDYDQDVDRNGYDRSGDGYAIDGGLFFTLTGKLNGDVYASYLERSYDDPRLPESSGWAAGAGLQWNPTYLTSIYARINSGIEETTSQHSSGYFRTEYSLRADHELKRFVQLTGFVSYSDNDYEVLPGAPADARRYDNVWRAGVGFNWFINRNVYLNTSYGWEDMETNVPGDGYTVNRVWLVLGLEK
jgi:hypothetical protein